MKYILSIVLFFAVTSYIPQPALIERVSASMESRQVQAGKSITIKGDLYFQNNGNMVTHFIFPVEYIVVANKVGEVKVYDPKKNTVLQYQNQVFSTLASQFSYFFTEKYQDMGLSGIGFVQAETKNEQGLIITKWKLKKEDKKAYIQSVKLVYQAHKPIYMHYENASGGIIRKVYYANYINLEHCFFPTSTTEIVYTDNNADSAVTKTTYSGFKLNHQASNNYMNFKIPSNAKTEK